MSEPVVVRGDDAWTAAIGVAREAFTLRVLHLIDGGRLAGEVADAITAGTDDVLSALFAPSRTPCATCEGTGDDASHEAARYYAEFEKIEACPDCTGGFVDGPSLADRIYGAERVGVAVHAAHEGLPDETFDWMEAYEPGDDHYPGFVVLSTRPVYTLAGLPREETQ